MGLLQPSSVDVSTLVAAVPYALSAAFVHSLVTVTDLVALEAAATSGVGGAGDGGDGGGNAGGGGNAAGKGGGSGIDDVAEDGGEQQLAGPFSLDHELGAIGVANLLSACCGAGPSYMQLTPSIVALRFRTTSKACGWCVAAISAASLPALTMVVSVVPRMVIAAFIMDMGVGFILGTGVETLRHTDDPIDQALLFLVQR